MIFPWMFDEIHALKPFKDAAHILAEKKDWPPLYDVQVLNNNKVVCSVIRYTIKIPSKTRIMIDTTLTIEYVYQETR